MNTKRNLPEMKELAAKKPKLVAELSRDEIYDSKKTIFGPECQTVDQDRELQSPGEHTFPANNPLNGDTDSELSDISVDCFSDLFTEDEPDRQPVAGNVDLAPINKFAASQKGKHFPYLYVVTAILKRRRHEYSVVFLIFYLYVWSI